SWLLAQVHGWYPALPLDGGADKLLARTIKLLAGRAMSCSPPDVPVAEQTDRDELYAAVLEVGAKPELDPDGFAQIVLSDGSPVPLDEAESTVTGIGTQALGAIPTAAAVHQVIAQLEDDAVSAAKARTGSPVTAEYQSGPGGRWRRCWMPISPATSRDVPAPTVDPETEEIRAHISEGLA
ncbi:MAG: hypothetical protein ACYDAG_12250, partial [Chloroflexota bacterium]